MTNKSSNRDDCNRANGRAVLASIPRLDRLSSTSSNPRQRCAEFDVGADALTTSVTRLVRDRCLPSGRAIQRKIRSTRIRQGLRATEIAARMRIVLIIV
jgi:hypothetical protein